MKGEGTLSEGEETSTQAPQHGTAKSSSLPVFPAVNNKLSSLSGAAASQGDCAQTSPRRLLPEARASLLPSAQTGSASPEQAENPQIPNLTATRTKPRVSPPSRSSRATPPGATAIWHEAMGTEGATSTRSLLPTRGPAAPPPREGGWGGHQGFGGAGQGERFAIHD